MKNSEFIPADALAPLVEMGEDRFVSEANISTIVGIAPEAYRLNVASHDACRKAGHALLQRIHTEGMSDELDMTIAAYLKKTKKTLQLMNERRTPATQIMDEIRSRYTALERDVDATKPDTIPAYLQGARNEYAARKRFEEAERRREALRRQHEIEALNRYRTDLENAYKLAVNDLILKQIQELNDLNKRVTRANAEELLGLLRAWNCTLDTSFAPNIAKTVLVPGNLSTNVAEQLPAQVWLSVKSGCEQQYTYEVTTNRDQTLYLVMGKAEALKTVAEGDTAAEAQILSEKKADDALAEQAAMLRQHTVAREMQQQMETSAQAAHLGDLFNAAEVAAPVYTPSTKVQKKVKVLAPEAFLQIISFWWSHGGSGLPIEELHKMFSKQVRLVEKMANQAQPVFLNHPSLLYEDEVKAK